MEAADAQSKEYLLVVILYICNTFTVRMQDDFKRYARTLLQ